MKRHPATLLLVLFSCLLLTPVGCGRKTPPVPPNTVMPKEITDLRQQLGEHGISLIWTAPRHNVKGEKLEQITSFELLRAVVAEDDYCEGCPVNFGRPIKIKTDKISPGDEVTHRETVLRPGFHYFYKVRTKQGWHITSNDSNIVTFVWNTLISPPTEVLAEISNAKIIISWQPPTTFIDNTKVNEKLKYQIFKSVDGASFVPLGSPVEQTTFTDHSIQKNKQYSYKIQPLGKRSVGMMSKRVQAQPSL